MRKLLIGLAAIVVVVGVGLYFVYSSLDSIAEAAIEQVGSDLTQTAVRVGGVRIDLGGGAARIGNLSVANPDGFTSDHALQVADISVALDLDNLSTDLITIKEVSVDNPQVTYEFGASGSNYDAIREALASAKGGGGGEPAADTPKIVIENLYIRNGTVEMVAPGGVGASAGLQQIHLTGIGRDGGGATAEQVGQVILTALLSGVTGTLDTLDPAQLSRLVNAGLGEAGGLIEDAGTGVGAAVEDVVGDTVGGVAEDVVGGAGEAAEGAGEAIRGLFGE